MHYTDRIAKLYALSEDEGRLSEATLAVAEKQAGGALPAALKQYLRRLGGSAAANQSFNRLLAATGDTRDSGDGFLIFCEEYQQVAVWGIRHEDSAAEDPPVYVCYNTAESDGWLLENEKLSAFLWKNALFNGTMEGLRFVANYVGEEPLPPAALQRIAERRQRLDELCDRGADYYTRGDTDAVVVCKKAVGEASALFVGSQDQECFNALLDIFDSDDDWSYTSYDEDDEE